MSIHKSTETPQAEAIAIDPHHWVENHADYLYKYAVTRINDEELARDLVQETFLAALERIDKFEGRSSERTWLTSILKNKVIDVYRKKSSGPGKNTIDLNTVQQDQDFFDANDGHWSKAHQPRAFGIEDKDPLMNKELNAILKRCMEKLPALWLSVFTMKHMDDESTDLICAELKVTPSNFWVIIHRAKLNLRACLQKNWI
ncbi:RNA polymerase subunit sigma-24 [Pedobacter lusitanus]|uniref:RNA polymerase subunit sigma-24 n=1 Tax=Pedobacter lusitanus TaxID=1503925 RepID=A0A0D0F060_9SPHI|nr:sigma-70 family RNA polymerase sigma factor [Pedobacter lusitanus]KIO75008.1 RNA polymerase subunit sigma-24 [Pedobacter lusitanus]